MLNTWKSTNPEKKDINDYVELGDVIAHRWDIIGTPIVDYAAYVRVDSYFAPYSTIFSSPNYGLLGAVNTLRIPEELEALRPGSQERIERVVAFRKRCDELALSYIKRAFPEDWKD